MRLKITKHCKVFVQLFRDMFCLCWNNSHSMVVTLLIFPGKRRQNVLGISGMMLRRSWGQGSIFVTVC